MYRHLYLPFFAILIGLQATAQSQIISIPIKEPSESIANSSVAWNNSSSELPISRPGKKNAAVSKENNFTSFTHYTTYKPTEITEYNKGYENDPDLGVLLPNAPCSDCYELLGKRTATQKYFVKEGTNTRQFILQSSNVPVHYKDAHGNWRNISDRLVPTGKGILATEGRPINITVNTDQGYVTLDGKNGSITYNRNLELIYVKPDGTEQPLGRANWANYTTGDNGLQVKNMWPGIDMELTVLINSAKTDFVITQPMPQYADGKLVIRDHMAPTPGLAFDQIPEHGHDGQIALKDASGSKYYTIQAATAYERNNRRRTTQHINYGMHNANTIDIEVPGEICNRQNTSYPLVVDPLVSGTESAGFDYSVDFAAYCTTENDVTIPAGATLSDIDVTYTYYGPSGISWDQSAIAYTINGNCYETLPTCSGEASGIPGTACGIVSASFWDYSSGYANWSACVPAFSCSEHTLGFQMQASQSYGYYGTCDQTAFATATGFTVDVYGTISTEAISPAAPGTICTGSTVFLSGSPYGGTWSTSSGTVASVNSSGLVTGIASGTAYVTYSASGACSASVPVTVVAPLTVASVSATTSSACIGTSVTLSDATSGGTWSSTNVSVASVGSSGSVNALSAGSTVISYSLSNVCGTFAASLPFTVNPLPDTGTITGASGICFSDSATTTLTESVTGTWSSSYPAVASINSSGIVTALSDGSTIISYTVLNAWCTLVDSRTINVGTIPASLLISGTDTLCSGTNITLTDATSGGTWSSSISSVASVGSSGTVAGISGGVTTIRYSLINSCGTFTDSTAVHVRASYSDVYTPYQITTIAGNGISGNTGDGGPATDAELSAPNGIAIDSDGTVYVISQQYVRMISPSGIISTYAGTGTAGYSGDGGPATAAEINNATNLGLDAAGNLYIVDRYNYRVRVINKATGIISTYAGNGDVSSTGDGGAAVLASINWPSSIAFDAGGVAYITDEAGAKVRSVNTSGTINTFAGTGISGFSGDGGSAISAQFNYDYSISIDAIGNKYISDYVNSRIRKISPSGIITTYAGTGAVGYSGDGGPATSAAFSNCYSNVIDAAGNLYICDGNNNRIRKIDASGIITTLAGTGVAGFSGDGGAPALAEVNSPFAVAVGPDGSVYFTDSYNNRVRKITFTPTSSNIAAITGADTICIAASATMTDTTAGGSGTWSSSNPAIASISSSGMVTGLSMGMATISYAVSNSCGSGFITKNIFINSLPVVSAISGTSTICTGFPVSLSDSAVGGTWSSSAASVATVNSSGIVVGISPGVATISYNLTNSCGTSIDSMILHVNTFYTTADTPYQITTIAGNGISGNTGDGGLATDAELSAPNGIAIDSDGTVYVISQQYVRVISPSGIISTYAGIGTAGYSGDGGPAAAAEINNATNLGLDAAGNLYIADRYNYRVRVINKATGIISTYAGNGAVSSTGDGGPAASASLNWPSSIFIDGGTAYITDEGGCKVRTVNTGGTINTFAGTGAPGFGGDGGAATGAQFNYDYCISIDGAGNKYISDYFNSRIRKISPSGIITTYAGTGAVGYSGDGGPATSAVLNHCWGNAVDAAGNLYVCDNNNRIRKINASGIISTFVGNGTAGFSGDGGAPALAEVNSPMTIAVGPDGSVYFTDTYNNRVRKITFTHPNIDSIVGIDTICVTTDVAFLDSTAEGSGTWSSSNPGVASVNSSGMVTGISTGVVTISYALSNSCGSGVTTKNVYVAGPPSFVLLVSDSIVCVGETITLGTTYTATGTWSSSAPAIATVSSSGVLTGITNGTVNITYTATNLCGSTSQSANFNVDCDLAVNSVKKGQESVLIYPNPNNSGIFTLLVSSTLSDIATITVQNEEGQTLKLLTVRTNIYNELSFDQPPGVYFVNIVSGEIKTTEKVVIIN